MKGIKDCIVFDALEGHRLVIERCVRERQPSDEGAKVTTLPVREAGRGAEVREVGRDEGEIEAERLGPEGELTTSATCPPVEVFHNLAWVFHAGLDSIENTWHLRPPLAGGLVPVSGRWDRETAVEQVLAIHLSSLEIELDARYLDDRVDIRPRPRSLNIDHAIRVFRHGNIPNH